MPVEELSERCEFLEGEFDYQLIFEQKVGRWNYSVITKTFTPTPSGC